MVVVNIGGEGSGKTYVSLNTVIPYLQSMYPEYGNRQIVLYDAAGSIEDNIYNRLKDKGYNVVYFRPNFGVHSFSNYATPVDPNIFFISMIESSNCIFFIDEGTSIFEHVKEGNIGKFSGVATRYRHNKISWVINFHTIKETHERVLKRAKVINLFPTNDKYRSLNGMYKDDELIHIAWKWLKENRDLKYARCEIFTSSDVINFYGGDNGKFIRRESYG